MLGLAKCKLAVFTCFIIISNLLELCQCGGTGPAKESRLESKLSPQQVSVVASGLIGGKAISSQPHPRLYIKRSLGPLKRSTSNSDEFYDYYYQDVEDPECPEDEFFHIRGRKCVPFDCPGGNQYRNKYNGECILKHYGIVEESRERPYKSLNRMSKQTKFRLPFGLTLKG